MSRPLPGPGCGPLAAAQYLVDYAMECEGLGLPITAAGLAECLATVSKSIGGPLPPLPVVDGGGKKDVLPDRCDPGAGAPGTEDPSVDHENQPPGEPKQHQPFPAPAFPFLAEYRYSKYTAFPASPPGLPTSNSAPLPSHPPKSSDVVVIDDSEDEGMHIAEPVKKKRVLPPALTRAVSVPPPGRAPARALAQGYAYHAPSGPDPTIPDFTGLSPEQKKVFEEVIAGHSVFFTGSAGTGKSFLLKRVVSHLKATHPLDSVFVTASTGIAACAIEGVTLHSFAGVGLAQEVVEVLVNKAKRNRKTSERWKNVEVLIIDEVSMINGVLFDKIEALARSMKKCEAPFGGIQVLISGDFFQLPPVTKGKEELVFAFQAKSWPSVIQSSVVLRQVFRQKEADFASILNELRTGTVSADALAVLGPCMADRGRGFFAPASAALSSGSPDIEYTVLHAKNVDVDSINNNKLAGIGSGAEEFVARDSGDLDQLRNLNVPDRLKLKVGAQVVLLKNLSPGDGLVNGSRGVVIGFVAPSVGPDPDDDSRSGVKAPMVKFTNGVERLIQPAEWRVELGTKTLAIRVMTPLRLAWSLSMHKSQGMSIDKLRICLDGVFEYGQAYVALSRATSLKGLIIEGFNPKLVNANPAVIDFYRRLGEDIPEPVREEIVLGSSQPRGGGSVPRARAFPPPPILPSVPPPAPPAPTPAPRQTTAADSDFPDLLDGIDYSVWDD